MDEQTNKNNNKTTTCIKFKQIQSTIISNIQFNNNNNKIKCSNECSTIINQNNIIKYQPIDKMFKHTKSILIISPEKLKNKEKKNNSLIK